MLENIKKALGFMLALILLAAFLGFGITSARTMPTYAQIFLDESSRTYIAPPMVKSDKGLRLSTVAEAYRLDYSPDLDSRDAGAFLQEDRSLTGHLLEWVGVLGPIPPRWNADGTWNY